MKRVLQCSICLLWAMLVFAPVPMRGEPSVEYDITTMRIVNDYSIADPMAPSRALRQHSVLWDTTHGTYLNYYPFTRFSILTGMLIDSGYTIDICATGIHTIDLSQYDIILISVMNSWNSPYTQIEIDSLTNFYNQGRQRVILTGDGNFCENTYIPYADNVQFSYNIFDWLGTNGGIFIMGDNSGCNNSNINPVANAFYMTAGISTISPSDLYFSNFTPHPIFNNVTQIYYRYAGAIAASSPAEPIAWTSAMEPVIGLLDESVGTGEDQGHVANNRVVQVDPNPFINQAVLSGISENEHIRVYDAGGRLVEVTTGMVFGGTLRPGVYFLEVQGCTPRKVIKLK